MYAIAYGQMLYEIRFLGPFVDEKTAVHYAKHEMPKTIIASWQIVHLQNSGDTLDYIIR